MYEVIKEAQMSLDKIKHNVIGIFKNHNNGVYEMILNHNTKDKTFTLVHITQFGAIQTSYGVMEFYGYFDMFPDNKNMHQMLETPYEWQNFMQQFKG